MKHFNLKSLKHAPRLLSPGSKSFEDSEKWLCNISRAKSISISISEFVVKLLTNILSIGRVCSAKKV